jgi:hypothetical protein
MPSLVSIRSGYWNDPTVWNLGVVPADGDSVTIATLHTVVFNVDQSSFPNGLAGLTIDGTLTIPSKAEDPSMPDNVVLKVNANIAGSGSLLIGSPTNPIADPQTVVVLVNGSVTVAILRAYGQARTPSYDVVARDAPGGTNSLTLQNGLPLRAGDVLAIGRANTRGRWITSGSPSDLYFTVQSYDPVAKTVRVTPPLSSARVRDSLVCLISRPIIFRRYGSSSANLIGSGIRTLRGCWLDLPITAGVWACNISAGVLEEMSDTALTGNLSSSGIWIAQPSHLRNLVAVFFGFVLLAGPAQGVLLTNVVILHCGRLGREVSAQASQIRAQNCEYVLHEGTSGWVIDDLWAVGVNGVFGSARGDFVRNVFVDRASWVCVHGSPIVENLVCGPDVQGIVHNDARETIFLRNVTLQGATTSIGGVAPRRSVIIRDLKGYLPSPPHPSSRSSFVNQYGEGLPVQALFYLEWQGYQDMPQARGRYFQHGFVVSNVLGYPPDPSTFDFRLTHMIALPIYLDWEINGAGTIRVTGTIVQLGIDESVTVQIFRSDKEPLLGDPPDFEQTVAMAGPMEVSWTPPDAGTWVVRILANLQQTINPIRIANLRVAGGGDTFLIGISESVDATLTDSGSLSAEISPTESLQPTVTDGATVRTTPIIVERLELPID